MASTTNHISKHLHPLVSFSFFLIFFNAFSLSSANPLSLSSPSFQFQKFDKKDTNFVSQISLYGDAKVNESGSYVQITEPQNFSGGKIMFKTPIKLLDGKNPRRKASFGTYFTFSMYPREGNGLVFSLSSSDGEVIVVQFDTKANAVKISLGNDIAVKSANVSKLKMVLYGQERVQCWIDYQASSSRVEVRLSKWKEKMPLNPLVSYPIDLSEMFKDDKVHVGLSSSNSNNSTTLQICNVYSWSFKLRQTPYWMHSQPLDPEDFRKDADPVLLMHKRKDCVFRLVMALIFGTACGGLGALLVLFVWAMFSAKRPVAPEEFAVHPVEFDCDKVKIIVVEKPAVKDGVNGKHS